MLEEGEIDVAPQRGGVSLSTKNFFQTDFESQRSKYRKGRVVVVCPKVYILVAKYLPFLAHHPDNAWRFKMILDYGGDSLKSLVQIHFDNNPLNFTTSLR